MTWSSITGDNMPPHVQSRIDTSSKLLALLLGLTTMNYWEVNNLKQQYLDGRVKCRRVWYIPILIERCSWLVFFASLLSIQCKDFFSSRCFIELPKKNEPFEMSGRMWDANLVWVRRPPLDASTKQGQAAQECNHAFLPTMPLVQTGPCSSPSSHFEIVDTMPDNRTANTNQIVC